MTRQIALAVGPRIVLAVTVNFPPAVLLDANRLLKAIALVNFPGRVLVGRKFLNDLLLRVSAAGPDAAIEGMRCTSNVGGGAIGPWLLSCAEALRGDAPRAWRARLNEDAAPYVGKSLHGSYGPVL